MSTAVAVSSSNGTSQLSSGSNGPNKPIDCSPTATTTANPPTSSAAMSDTMRLLTAAGAAPQVTPSAAPVNAAAFAGLPPFLARSEAAGLPPALLEQYRAMGAGAPPGIPPMPFFPGFPPGELKPEGMPPAALLAGPPQPMPGYFYDPMMGACGYGGPMDLNGARRKNATRETTAALKAWLYEHRKNPYPTKGEKIMLAIITKMSLTQVSTWFANARRRLKKENKMTWSPRNRPGEDDDLGAPLNDDSDGRPMSGMSDLSDDGHPPTMLHDRDLKLHPHQHHMLAAAAAAASHQHNGTEPNNNNATLPPTIPQQFHPGGLKHLKRDREPEPNESTQREAKKPKIWSIADTVGQSASSSTSQTHNTSKDSVANTSGTSSTSDQSGSSGDTKPAGSTAPASTTATTLPPQPSVPGPGQPYHFTFNPWHQQMAALSALRPPGPNMAALFGMPGALRPELFMRPPGVFSHGFGLPPGPAVSAASLFAGLGAGAPNPLALAASLPTATAASTTVATSTPKAATTTGSAMNGTSPASKSSDN